MRTFKRNAVILTVVLFVCVAAYLNWSYGKKADEVDTIGSTPPVVVSPPVESDEPTPGAVAEPSDAGLYYSEPTEPVSDFFAVARINRQQARDSAAETLATVSSTDGASQEIIDAALVAITQIAQVSKTEAELESLIMAKGYSDCVVFISDDGVKVTVPAPMEGLSSVAVAQITDVVTGQTEFTAADLHVIEVK